MTLAFMWGGIAAASLLIGYALAWRGLSKRVIGGIMAIGAGALISAIAYELVPESALGGQKISLAFLLGALTFFGADWIIDHRGGAHRKDISGDQPGAGAAIFIGTLLDGIPESIILGMGLAAGDSINLAFLTAVFISNLPEGVAGTLNLASTGVPRRRIFWMWLVLALFAAVCAALGYAIVEAFPSVQGTYYKAFAAGAMLTMLAEAMMPEAYEEGGKLVGLFTVLGFLLATVLSIFD
jgi:ZIP family zinc transporter